MRLTVMIAILLLAAAGTCRAAARTDARTEDPLESLNTVEETLSELAQHRAVHGSLPPESGRRPQELSAGVAGGGDPVPAPEGKVEPPAGDAPSAEEPH